MEEGDRHHRAKSRIHHTKVMRYAEKSWSKGPDGTKAKMQTGETHVHERGGGGRGVNRQVNGLLVCVHL